MTRLRDLAFLTVGRAIGFAGLVIVCVMAALSFDPLLAVRSGGVLVSVTLAVLVYRLANIAAIDHRRTEMWLYLEPDERPAEAQAQGVVSAALKEAYAWFAHWTAGTAALLWLLSLVLSLTEGGG